MAQASSKLHGLPIIGAGELQIYMKWVSEHLYQLVGYGFGISHQLSPDECMKLSTNVANKD